MSRKFLPVLICSISLLAACGEEPQPRSVQEFVDNPQFLEAAVVRCAVNRDETRYDTECVNARQAVALIEAREDRARRERLEAESASKRAALRRTQTAAAAARREAAERARLRKEAEYLAQFGETLPPRTESDATDLGANIPGAVIPSPPQQDQPDRLPVADEPVRPQPESTPAAVGGNAPLAKSEEQEADLGSIRDELRRRQDEGGN